MGKKVIKVIILLLIIGLLSYFFTLKNNNDKKEAKNRVENFCNNVKVGFNLPDYKHIDPKKIVYNDKKFFEYDERSFNGTAICMVELDNGKVISKKFKYLH